jgi:hypothetical protein
MQVKHRKKDYQSKGGVLNWDFKGF